MIRAVLFDAVGTLIQLRTPVGETYARYAAEHGVRIAATALQTAFRAALRQMPPMVFAGAEATETRARERDWWRTVVRSTFDRAGLRAPWPDFETCFARLFAHYGRAEAWRSTDGAIDALRAARAGGLRTGLVSNFDHRLPAVLDALGLAPLLDTIVLPRDAGAAKPDRRIFALALARLDTRPENAVYVGDDADDDIAGAARAGLHAIDVTTLADLRRLAEVIAAMP